MSDSLSYGFSSLTLALILAFSGKALALDDALPAPDSPVQNVPEKTGKRAGQDTRRGNDSGTAASGASDTNSGKDSTRKDDAQENHAATDRHTLPYDTPDEVGVAGNPAIDVLFGSGLLGRTLGFDEESGIHLGGLWVGNADVMLTGGLPINPQTSQLDPVGGKSPSKGTFNSLFILGGNIDLGKYSPLKGGSLGAAFLQYNGQASNANAGALPGYNGINGQAPYNRSELYELWYKQTLLDDRLTFRLGKSVPTFEFNNVLRSLVIAGEKPFIPSISGLLYSPVFINPTLLGVMPGYYNSAWGLSTTVTPMQNTSVAYGVYDGSNANQTQTGLHAGPIFNNGIFNIGEVGQQWGGDLPGRLAVGGWGQTGTVSTPIIGGPTSKGAMGTYALATNRLAHVIRQDGEGSVIGYMQYGINNSRIMPVNQYAGGGISGFGLIPHRPKDSIGLGVAVSWLNTPTVGSISSPPHPTRINTSNMQFMSQFYYQAHVIGDVYFTPAFTYIPNPGQPVSYNLGEGSSYNSSYPSSTSLIFQLTTLF